MSSLSKCGTSGEFMKLKSFVVLFVEALQLHVGFIVWAQN